MTTIPLLAIQNRSIGGYSVSVAKLGALSTVTGLTQISSNFVFPALFGYLGQRLFAIAAIVIAIGYFIIPFLFLMSRHIRRSRILLTIGASWVLFAHWYDMTFHIIH